MNARSVCLVWLAAAVFSAAVWALVIWALIRLVTG